MVLFLFRKTVDLSRSSSNYTLNESKFIWQIIVHRRRLNHVSGRVIFAPINSYICDNRKNTVFSTHSMLFFIRRIELFGKKEKSVWKEKKKKKRLEEKKQRLAQNNK